MIHFARRIGGPAGPVAALLAMALATASASGAAPSSVSISGPRNVTAGQKVKLRFTGYAAPGVRRLRVWLDDRRCAASARAEGARPELRTPSNFSVGGDFRAVLTVTHSSTTPNSTTSTHFVCAYLLYQGSQATAARATRRYVTRTGRSTR